MKSSKKNILTAVGIGAASIALGVVYSFYNFKKIKNSAAICDIDLQKFLGKWYELARVDNNAEKNLTHITIEYSFNIEGSIKVDNKGFDTNKNKWQQHISKAKILNVSSDTQQKLSLFGSSYTTYTIISVDENYSYALLSAGKRNLWILSRNMNLPDHIKYKYLKMARDLGYTVDKLVWTKHG